MDNLQVLRVLCRQDKLSKGSVESIVKSKTGLDVVVANKHIGKDGFEKLKK